MEHRLSVGELTENSKGLTGTTVVKPGNDPASTISGGFVAKFISAPAGASEPDAVASTLRMIACMGIKIGADGSRRLRRLGNIPG
jgi:hypothetical protein